MKLIHWLRKKVSATYLKMHQLLFHFLYTGYVSLLRLFTEAGEGVGF